MKAISLWEPWASLIRTGAKTIETRHWETEHRGRLLICASKGGLTKVELIRMLAQHEFQKGLAWLRGPEQWWDIRRQDLNFGMAVAIVEVVDCFSTNDIPPHYEKNVALNAHFGNFEPYRYCWMLNLLRRDFKPFPVKGCQGFFNVDDALIEKHLLKGGGNE